MLKIVIYCDFLVSSYKIFISYFKILKFIYVNKEAEPKTAL